MITNLIIVEDDTILRMIAIKMIEILGVTSLKIQECEDGEIGIKTMEKLSNTKDKVIVLLDINMPVLNGWGFLDELMKNKNYNIQNIAVYIVSSSTDPNDILKAKNYEVVKQFIIKPIDKQILKTIICG